MRAAVAIVAIAACGPRAAPGPAPGSTHVHAWGEPTVTRGAPVPFLDEPSVAQVAISTTTPTEWGSGTVTHVQLVRGGRVVCEYDGDSSSAAEDHTHRTDAYVVPRGRDPLRFEVRTAHWSNDGATSMDTCTRYELPATGACKVTLQRTCTITCTPEVAVAQRPGTGKVVVSATGDGEPLPDVMIASTEASEASFTDAAGAARFDAGATRTLQISTGAGNAMVSIDPRPAEDTVVTITATGCSCCAAPAR